MKMRGAKIVVQSLIKEGVEVCFGYPGGANLPLFDEIYQHRDKIQHILVRHEQGAAHMADGYARATGKPGVCIATSGPGATNLVTGIATAMMDSIPMVCITGQVRRYLLGTDAFQESDVIGITRPITKHNYLVSDVRDLARVMKEAFHIATTGRPGPVLVDLPVDMTNDVTDFVYPETVSLRGYHPYLQINPKQIEQAADLINKSKRPVLYVGGGAINGGAHQALRKLSEKTGIPVTCTLMGLGAFPGTHPNSLGMLGMHGTAWANHSMQNADLLIAVGSRFDDRVTGKLAAFAKRAKIIHVDVDPTSHNKNVPVDIAILGDSKDFCETVLPLVKKLDLDAWYAQIGEWKQRWPLKYNVKENQMEGRLKPQFVIERLYAMTKGDAVITTEVGQHQMWAAQFYLFDQPRRWITSGGLGTMGFGLPAAIGAKFGCPDKTVIDIAGDASIQMTIQEFGTAVQYKVPFIAAVLDNIYLGMVRQWQEFFYEKRYSESHLGDFNPDFVKLAESFGAKGRKVTKPEDVDEAIREAIDANCPYMLHFRVDPDENTYPMVPAGAALDEMIYEDPKDGRGPTV